MQSRRDVLTESGRLGLLLLACGVGVSPGRAAEAAPGFDARTLPDALQALGFSMPVASPLVSVTAPEIAENGASVPISIGSTAPEVQRLLLLIERNPFPLIADFDVSALVEPEFALRVKMAETSPVLAVAVLSDGRLLHARRDVTVILGGCGV